jgi:hypothetical protein
MYDGALLSIEAQRARPGTSPEDVAFELLRYDRGSFTFRSDEPLPAAGPGRLDLDVVLHGARLLLDEWEALRDHVPSLDHHVVLRPRLVGDTVTIDARAWSTLQAVGAGRSVSQLAGVLDVDEIECVRRVRDLLDMGVAELVAPVGVPRHRR